MNEYVSFPGLGIEPFHMDKTFTVFGRDIAWYGVIICIGIILAVTYSLLRAKYTEKIGIDPMTDLAFFLVLFGIIGARLYYVIFEFDRYVVTGEGFFGNILGTLKNAVAVWEGGLAIYGAIIAGFITILIFCKIKKIELMKVLDLAAPGVMIGQLIGRWGNFVNVEAYGSATNLPWRMGIHVPDPLFDNAAEMGIWVKETYVHPTFLYESFWNLVGFVIANLIYRKKRFNGQIFYFYIGWYGFGRMFIEGLRTDSLYIGSSDIRVSQLVAFATFVVGAVMSVLLYVKARKNHEYALDCAVPAMEGAPRAAEAEIAEAVADTEAAEAAEAAEEPAEAEETEDTPKNTETAEETKDEDGEDN